MHLYGKNVQNFKQLLLWSLGVNFAQISYGASLGRGNKRLLKWSRFVDQEGVVGWCEGAVYLTSLGRPTDIGLQLGKACYPCSG